ncbi:hypothetical protein EHQ53_00580 [Leptospira langatensis]|uniref:Uncharacterized protein n=1 Tax=Leptospira langatensis TaxID=2484983 RepID=A0A5F1ZWJ9_9LEPT|nr:hypothetical protein [Leptospira langatensis]TGJ98262.1 hypothetical protein EHO57_16725 [Leptospira langatensis]TGL43176.1 hypothetical protein EHQ53_00580 [Leptospira langatensis]
MFFPILKSFGPSRLVYRYPLILWLLAAVSLISFPFFHPEAEEKETVSQDSSLGDLNDPDFVSGWKKYSQEKDARPLKQWFQTHPVVQTGDCKFRSLPDLEGSQYFSLDCTDKKMPGFFFAGKDKILYPNKISSFHVRGPVKTGKMVYWQLGFSSDTLRLATGKFSESNKDKRSKINDKASTENFGLQYFLSIARHPASRPAPVGKEIFFDSSCPLLYLGKDADFYWDKVLYFSFQASCIPSSPYSWIRIKADAGGNVQVDDKPLESLEQGARFLAKLKLQSIEKDKIVWSDGELFHE